MIAPPIVSLVNKKWIKAIKAPSNYTPNYEVIVTGLKANQNITSDVFATIKRDIPEPRPYPFDKISSNKITTHPAPINCSIIKTIVELSIWDGIPYAPYQIAPTAYPKQKIKARIF